MRVDGRSALLGAVMFSPMKALRVVQTMGKALLWWALGVIALGRLAWQWWQGQEWWLQSLVVFVTLAVVLRVDFHALRGAVRRAPKAVIAEPVSLGDQVTFLYRWYDASGELLYVGISNDLARRTGQHIADKPWMTEAARCDATSYPNRQAALDAEEQAIWREGPLHNIVHNR